MQKRIFLSPPKLNGREIEFVNKAFEENWIAPCGPNLTAFEDEICRYNGIGYAVAMSSGTAAMHLALKYVGVEQGDTVFCSDLTFSGSCNPVLYQGARLVLIDSEEESFNMSPTALEKAFVSAQKSNELPRAVIIVDLYGQSADYDKLLPICEKYGVPVIEDAAEALGAEYKGKKCGKFGYISVFSFNGNKIITTSGGGMAVSDDENATTKINFWANQSKEKANYYLHNEIGYNYRMSNISAGIGRGQLITIEENINRRKEIFEFYQKSFRNLPITMQPILEGAKPNYWLSVLMIDDDCKTIPDDVINALEKDNIEARRAWNPMHCQPIFKDCEFFAHYDNASVSRHVFDKGICMPSGSQMTQEDLERVTSAFIGAFNTKT
ncbi:MAG TPA: DegT/DnrJ/EryC1/StrS family aminotransferase [Clostridia bacterium]|nr:DegT/DnrJ/EryC1/StrS family aminotransferase [Clostridia bacterium]